MILTESQLRDRALAWRTSADELRRLFRCADGKVQPHAEGSAVTLEACAEWLETIAKAKTGAKLK